MNCQADFVKESKVENIIEIEHTKTPEVKSIVSFSINLLYKTKFFRQQEDKFNSWSHDMIHANVIFKTVSNLVI